MGSGIREGAQEDSDRCDRLTSEKKGSLAREKAHFDIFDFEHPLGRLGIVLHYCSVSCKRIDFVQRLELESLIRESKRLAVFRVEEEW